jgi:hypothetical protein
MKAQAKLLIAAALSIEVSTIHAQSATDRFGNRYALEDIQVINPGQLPGFPQRGGGIYPSCSAGIFNLEFVDFPGVGFADAVLGPQRQLAACMAFSDLSAALVPAANPYTAPALARPASFVNIRLYSVNTGGQAAGRGSSYYNELTTGDGDNNPMNDLNPQATREGVIDGEVWKTINGGFDSWFTTISPHNPGTLPPWQWYHGYVEIDFTNYNFYDGATLPAPPGMPDLYLVVAHEAMHILGFISHMNATGQSTWLPGSNYYSRYDAHLRPQLLDFILDPNACYDWGSNYSLTSDLTDPCNVFFTGSNSLYDVPVFAPTGLTQSSLEHLDGECTNGENYLMHFNNLNPNGQSRIPIQTELNILCDLDFNITTAYGGSGWDGTSATVVPCGARLAGVDDIYADPPSQTMYKCYQSSSISIDNFLDNDNDALLGGPPTDHSCLTILTGGGALSSITNNSFVYTPDPAFVGLAVLRYKPRNVGTDREGNLTYIFIPVWPESACDNCTIVKGGDFEGLDLTNVTGMPHSAWRINNPNMNNTPDLLAWNGTNWYTSINGLPGLTFPRNCAFGSSTPVVPSHNGQPLNNRYMAMVKYGNDSYREGLMFELCEPLIPGVDYVLSFWAMNTSSACNNSIEFYSSDTEPCNYMQGVTNAPGLNNCNGNVFTVASLVPNQPLTQNWPLVPYEVSFTYSQPLPGNWLMLVISANGQNNVNGVVFVDDVVIRPLITATPTITPACNGQNNGTISLDVHYYPGSYSILWNTGATTATLADLAPGTYTVTITDTELGCATFTESYVVGDAACDEDFTLTKTVSTTHTYSGAPVLYTITVCNNTTASADVQLSDLGLSNFVATSISPAWATFPNAGTFTVPAGGCTMVEIAGHFVAIGTYTNQAHLDPDGNEGNGDELDAYADPVTVLQNCPLVVSGTGDCVTGPVTLCMGVHSLITDVGEIDFDWVYPNFLTPPDQANLLTALVPPPGQSFDPAGCTIGTPAVYDPDNNVVHVHLKYQDPINTAGIHRLFCLPFDLTGTPPAGQNQFLTMVLGSHGQHHSDLYDSNGNEIHPAVGFWTQAANVILTGCPGIQNLDASFTVDLPACGGAVSVHGNLNDPGAVHFWTWGDERTTPINGTQDYTYDYFAPITMNTDWPVVPPIPGAPPGTYTITHTVILNGVASTSTQSITIFACCTADLSIPNGTLSSSLPSTVSGTVDIQGQFIIDQDFTFSSAQVTTEPGAEIIVQPGRNFNVFNSTIESCHGVMWRGITAQDGTIVQVDNSYLADAESGWTGMNSSILLVSASEFANNRVAISVPAIPGVNFNSVSIHADNSEFHAEGPLAQPYPGQTSVLGQQGFAALDVHNIALNFTGHANELHDLSNGIVARRCNVRVANCTMHDIQPDAAYDYTGNGAGVYARGDHGFFSLKQNGYGMSDLAAASFTNCRWGIYTQYMNVYSTANRMVDMGTAHRVDFSGSRKVIITGNKLDTRYNSIDLRFNDGAVQLLVTDNDITFGSLNHENTKGYAAINVQEGNAANPSSVIQGNTIRYRHGSPYAANGIALLSASDYNVLGNTLLMDNNAVNNMGIIAAGCGNPLVSCNDVHGSATNYGVALGQSAIRNNMGDHATIYCNTVDGTTNGIYFSGPCYGTDLSGNSIMRHQWGLHLDNNAIIEEQDFKGNLWYNVPVNGGLGAWYENAFNASIFPFLYAPAIISGGNTEPPSWSPTYWFNSHSGTNYQCGDEQSGYCGHVVRENCEGCATGLDQKIAADSLANDPYTEETKWMMEGDLYAKLDNDSSLAATDQELADFYADMQGTTAAQFKLINDDYLALFHLDSTVLDYLAQNKAQLEDLMDQLKWAMDSLRDTSLTNAERMALQSTIGGLKQNISSLTALNNQALALADTSRVLTAEGVKTANAAIATSELIEANEKQVNEIYLGTVAKGIDGFTPAQASALFDIANQCPLVGGNAVYRARAMYALIDDEQAYDDPALCLQHGLIYRSMQQAGGRAVSVVPNPASEMVTLRYGLDADETGTFTLYDALGHPVLSQALPPDIQELKISTARLSPAAYHYVVHSSRNGLLGSGRLVIIH